MWVFTLESCLFPMVCHQVLLSCLQLTIAGFFVVGPQTPGLTLSIVELHPDSVILPLSIILEVSQSSSVLTMFVSVFCTRNTLPDFETSRSMRPFLMDLSQPPQFSLMLPHSGGSGLPFRQFLDRLPALLVVFQIKCFTGLQTGRVYCISLEISDLIRKKNQEQATHTHVQGFDGPSVS